MLSASGKFVYNKLKQGNFQKTDVEGESQDIWEILKNMAILGWYAAVMAGNGTF